MADHAAKAFIGKLGDRAKAKVEGALPEDQYGGRKGGGTDIPAHIIQSLLAFARMAGMSVFFFSSTWLQRTTQRFEKLPLTFLMILWERGWSILCQ